MKLLAIIFLLYQGVGTAEGSASSLETNAVSPTPRPAGGAIRHTPGLGPSDLDTYLVADTGVGRDTLTIGHGLRRWEPGDALCILHARFKVCGIVAEVSNAGGQVRLKQPRGAWSPGERLTVRYLGRVAVPPAAGGPPRIALQLIPRLTSFSRDSTDNATGAKAHLSSTLNTGVRLEGAVVWGPNFQTTAFLDVARYGVSPVTPGTMTATSQALVDFGVGFGYHPWGEPRILVRGNVGFHDQSILMATSPTDLTLSHAHVPAVNLSAAYAFYRERRFAASAEVAGGLYFSGIGDRFVVRDGSVYSAKLIATRPFDTFLLRGGVFVQRENVDANITNHVQTEYGVELGFGVGF